mmetsp:Transcript_9501/g.31159  ORF Transcript_9501/g.31159 Transcript_9501/m.31159 type:complete len:97 (+) Transcript_9501:23-313(+)
MLSCPLSAVVAAFSRDGAGKVYVQHKIREHGARVWELLSRGAYFLVAGAAGAMPRDVQAALESVAWARGGFTDEPAAREYVAGLQRQGRYQVESWS